MNKFWGVLAFALCLVASWYMIHAPAAIGSETHIGIQTQMRDMILTSVAKKHPEAKNVRIVKLWTENLDTNKVRAVFQYAFDESTPGVTALQPHSVEGEAVLHREPSDDARLDRWALQSVKTTSDQIDFDEGSVITPNAPAGETDPSAPTAPAAAPAAPVEAPKADEHH